MCSRSASLIEHDANVVHHRQHHLAQVLGLLLFARREIDLADLGDAFDDVRHLLAEFLADVDDRDGRVFDRIVQQSRGHRDRVHLHFGQHQRHFQRMNQVGLPRRALLPGMVLLRELVRLAHQFQIVVGTVLPHLPQQLAEQQLAIFFFFFLHAFYSFITCVLFS